MDNNNGTIAYDDFMNKTDDEYQKELDFYGQFPQLKYKQEMFAKQYDEPDKELSETSKTYSKLHNARQGLEALPIAAGTNMTMLILTSIIDAVASSKGKYPLRRFYNGENPSTTVYDIGGRTYDKEMVDNAMKIANDVNTKGKSVKTIGVNVDPFTKDKPVVDDYSNIKMNSNKVNPSSKNEMDLKQTIKDLDDDTIPKDNTYTTVGKKLNLSHPKLAKAISNALKLAKVAADLGTSYLAGKGINKLTDDNYDATLAAKYTRDNFYSLPDDARKYIKENGLNEDIFNKYVKPYLEFADVNAYGIDEKTLRSLLDEGKFDELNNKYGIDTRLWRKLDEKGKKNLENEWLNSKVRTHAYKQTNY